MDFTERTKGTSDGMPDWIWSAPAEAAATALWLTRASPKTKAVSHFVCPRTPYATRHSIIPPLHHSTTRSQGVFYPSGRQPCVFGKTYKSFTRQEPSRDPSGPNQDLRMCT